MFAGESIFGLAASSCAWQLCAKCKASNGTFADMLGLVFGVRLCSSSGSTRSNECSR